MLNINIIRDLLEVEDSIYASRKKAILADARLEAMEAEKDTLSFEDEYGDDSDLYTDEEYFTYEKLLDKQNSKQDALETLEKVFDELYNLRDALHTLKALGEWEA